MQKQIHRNDVLETAGARISFEKLLAAIDRECHNELSCLPAEFQEHLLLISQGCLRCHRLFPRFRLVHGTSDSRVIPDKTQSLPPTLAFALSLYYREVVSLTVTTSFPIFFLLMRSKRVILSLGVRAGRP